MSSKHFQQGKCATVYESYISLTWKNTQTLIKTRKPFPDKKCKSRGESEKGLSVYK